MQTPLATFQFKPGAINEALEFLKRTRSELRMLRKVRIWKNRFQIVDINGDSFEIDGIGYLDEQITIILDTVNTAYKQDLIHKETEDEFKEFKTGRRYCWAQDRVM